MHSTFHKNILIQNLPFPNRYSKQNKCSYFLQLKIKHDKKYFFLIKNSLNIHFKKMRSIETGNLVLKYSLVVYVN